MRRSYQGQPATPANELQHRSWMHGATLDVADPTMPLRQALELALSHAAQAEQRIAELHQKGILSDEEFKSKKAELLSRL